MRPARLPLTFALAAFLAVAVFFLRRPAADAPDVPAATTPAAAPAVGSTPAAPAPPAFAPEEVFRRAFWRQPTPADRILHTERVETRTPSGEVQAWRWHIALHPGPDLLAALRSPDTFGLRPLAANAPATDASAAPAHPRWFPAPADEPTFERLQAPGGSLLVLYRASDNLLFATDQGQGFTAPAR